MHEAQKSLTSETPAAPEPSARRSRWLGLAGGALLLVAIQVLIWWGYTGHTQLHGDDIAETGYSGISRMTQLLRGEILGLIQGRSFLGLSYWQIYHSLLGESFARSQIFFAAFDVLSAFLVWILLRRVTSAIPALLGALLFTGYSSAYDTQIVFCMGFYPVVLCIHVFLLWLGLSPRVPLWVKSLVTGVLGVISMAWYEFFVPMLPLYPAAWWIASRGWEKGWRGLPKVGLAALFPVALTGLYLLALKSVAHPVWERDAASQGEHPGIVSRLVLGAIHALDKTMGIRHGTFVAGNWHAYLIGYASTEPVVWALAAGVLAGILALLIHQAKRAKDEASTPAIAWGGWALLLGLYILVIPGSLSGLLGVGACPPRLTLYPSLGLAMCVAGLLNLAWQRLIPWRNRVGVLLFGIMALAVTGWSLAEAVTLNSINHQEMEGRKWDDRIAKKIAKLYPHPRKGDHFFLCAPVADAVRSRRWYSGHTAFQQGEAYALLWHTYGVDVNDLLYTPLLRRGKISRYENWESLIEASRKDAGHLVPFLMKKDGTIQPISRLMLGNPGSEECWEYSAFGDLDGGLQIRVLPAAPADSDEEEINPST